MLQPLSSWFGGRGCGADPVAITAGAGALSAPSVVS
jgi:hypothetical protein